LSNPTRATKKQLDECDREWERLVKTPPTDVEAFAGLVLAYVGPVPDPLLDGDAELRRRATAILATLRAKKRTT